MKLFFVLLTTLFLATPAWAVDVQMGSGGNLVLILLKSQFSAGESFTLLTICSPHNVIVEDHPELGHGPCNDARRRVRCCFCRSR